MTDETIFLEPYTKAPLSQDNDDPKTWPVAATNPPVLIPGITDCGALYPIEKIEAHVKGLHHLAISVFIFSGNALLIQRRAKGKYHCGGMWANTCCTHPHFGESPQATALRRLKEELGFQVPVEQRQIVEYSADVGGELWERERVHMFRSDVDLQEITIKLNPDEVSEARWMDKDQLRKDVLKNPDNYTPWFKIYLGRYPGLDF